MKKIFVGLCILALAASTVTAAHADTFNFTFSDIGIFGFSGSGTFEATEVGNSDIYHITAVTGSVNDFFLGTSQINGLLGLNQFKGNDNELIYPGTGLFGEKFFDSDGVSFSLKNGNDINLKDDGLEEAFGGNPKDNEFEFDIVDVDRADPPAVPEPSSLALFGTGLLGVAGVVKRKLSA